MSPTQTSNWQAIQDALRGRISRRDWAPGDLIPNEADLAAEFGCARATMNRALRGLAEEGLLERRRKAGTRVAVTPVRQARFEIPVLREEIQSRGHRFSHRVLSRAAQPPPDALRERVGAMGDWLHLETLYLADDRAYAHEDRWINLDAVPQAQAQSFAEISPNEWLVREVPFDGGDFTLSATSATMTQARHLDCMAGTGLMVLDRTTQHRGRMVTSVRVVFHDGYRLQTML